MGHGWKKAKQLKSDYVIRKLYFFKVTYEQHFSRFLNEITTWGGRREARRWFAWLFSTKWWTNHNWVIKTRSRWWKITQKVLFLTLRQNSIFPLIFCHFCANSNSKYGIFAWFMTFEFSRQKSTSVFTSETRDMFVDFEPLCKVMFCICRQYQIINLRQLSSSKL